MALEIEWSNEAQNSLDKLYDYLEQNWPHEVIIKFSRILEKKLQLISENPTLYKASVRLSNTRECIVTKHNTFFYKYSEGKIFIVSFWANYQNLTKVE